MDVPEADEPHGSALAGAFFGGNDAAVAGSFEGMKAGMLAAAVLLGALARVAGADPVLVPVVNLTVKDDPSPPIDPHKRSFKFRAGTKLAAVHIALPAIGSAGNPTLWGATLVLYNAAGTGEFESIDLPPTEWHVIGTPANVKGYQFHDVTPADGPIVRLYVKPDKIFVSGGKDSWPYPLEVTPQQTLAVRLALGTGAEWCGAAPAKSPTTLYDTPAKFVGLKGSLAATCPPVP